MDKKTIIFDCIMVASYLANLLYMIAQFIKMAKGVMKLDKDCEGLNEEAAVNLYHERYKQSVSKFTNFAYANVGFLLVGIIATLLDGISGFNKETMRIAMPVALLAFIYSGLSISFYKKMYKKKYDTKFNRNDFTKIWYNVPGSSVPVHIITTFAFAVHTGLLAYTIALWVV